MGYSYPIQTSYVNWSLKQLTLLCYILAMNPAPCSVSRAGASPSLHRYNLGERHRKIQDYHPHPHSGSRQHSNFGSGIPWKSSLTAGADPGGNQESRYVKCSLSHHQEWGLWSQAHMNQKLNLCLTLNSISVPFSDGRGRYFLTEFRAKITTKSVNRWPR